MTDKITGNTEWKTGRFLAIDTSTASLTIAVLEQDRVLGELNTVADRNHSIGLLPNIRQLLGELAMKPRDLEAVAVGQGPGSYTGVRIGVSAAKTFAWSLGIPLLGVSSLEALAYSAALADRAAVPVAPDGGATWIVPLMDARRTQAFTAAFAAAAGDPAAPLQWRRVRPDGIRLMGDWADELLALLAAPDALPADAAADAAPRRIVFAGETAGFAEPMARVATQAGCAVAALPHALQASALGLLAYPRLARGERDDVHGFVPNYAQLPEAEVKLLAKVQKGDD